MAPTSSPDDVISCPRAPGPKGGPFLWFIRPQGGGSASRLPSGRTAAQPGLASSIPSRHPWPPSPSLAAAGEGRAFSMLCESSVWGPPDGDAIVTIWNEIPTGAEDVGGARGVWRNSCCPAVAGGGGTAGLLAELGFWGLTRGRSGGGESGDGGGQSCFGPGSPSRSLGAAGVGPAEARPLGAVQVFRGRPRSPLPATAACSRPPPSPPTAQSQLPPRHVPAAPRDAKEPSGSS